MQNRNAPWSSLRANRLSAAFRDGASPGRFRPRDLMGEGIALDDDPAPAAVLVPPLLPHPALGVVVVVDVVDPLGVGERRGV